MDDELDAQPVGRAASGRLIAVVIVVAVVVAAVAGYLWFDIKGTRPLPGEPLAIVTDPPPVAGATCAKNVIPPAKLLVVGDSLVLIASNGGEEIPVAWPNGYAARLNQGRGELYGVRGFLVAVENDNIQERFYGAAGADGVFHICKVARD